jgi:hypothetical protein
MSSKNNVACKVCSQPISIKAKICNHCNSYQNGFLRVYKLYENTINILLVIASILVSGYFANKQLNASDAQLQLAKTQYEDSKKQLSIAEEASKNAVKAREEAQKAKDDAINAKNQALLSVNNVNKINDELITEKKYRVHQMYRHTTSSFVVLIKNDLRNITLEYDLPHKFISDNGYHQFSVNSPIYNNFSLSKENYSDIYFDILETSFFKWYSEKYNGSWLIKNESYGMHGGGSQIITKPIKTINKKEISQKLYGNRVLNSTFWVNDYTVLNLPPNTNFISEREDINIKNESKFKIRSRRIVFDNPLYEISIYIRDSGTITDNGNAVKLHELDIRRLGLERYFNESSDLSMIEYKIDYYLKIKDNFIFKPENADIYYWAEHLGDNIRESFDWNTFYK